MPADQNPDIDIQEREKLLEQFAVISTWNPELEKFEQIRDEAAGARDVTQEELAEFFEKNSHTEFFLNAYAKAEGKKKEAFKQEGTELYERVEKELSGKLKEKGMYKKYMKNVEAILLLNAKIENLKAEGQEILDKISQQIIAPQRKEEIDKIKADFKKEIDKLIASKEKVKTESKQILLVFRDLLLKEKEVIEKNYNRPLRNKIRERRKLQDQIDRAYPQYGKREKDADKKIQVLNKEISDLEKKITKHKLKKPFLFLFERVFRQITIPREFRKGKILDIGELIDQEVFSAQLSTQEKVQDVEKYVSMEAGDKIFKDIYTKIEKEYSENGKIKGKYQLYLNNLKTLFKLDEEIGKLKTPEGQKKYFERIKSYPHPAIVENELDDLNEERQKLLHQLNQQIFDAEDRLKELGNIISKKYESKIFDAIILKDKLKRDIAENKISGDKMASALEEIEFLEEKIKVLEQKILKYKLKNSGDFHFERVLGPVSISEEFRPREIADIKKITQLDNSKEEIQAAPELGLLREDLELEPDVSAAGVAPAEAPVPAPQEELPPPAPPTAPVTPATAAEAEAAGEAEVAGEAQPEKGKRPEPSPPAAAVSGAARKPDTMLVSPPLPKTAPEPEVAPEVEVAEPTPEEKVAGEAQPEAGAPEAAPEPEAKTAELTPEEEVAGAKSPDEEEDYETARRKALEKLEALFPDKQKSEAEAPEAKTTEPTSEEEVAGETQPEPEAETAEPTPEEKVAGAAQPTLAGVSGTTPQAEPVAPPEQAEKVLGARSDTYQIVGGGEAAIEATEPEETEASETETEKQLLSPTEEEIIEQELKEYQTTEYPEEGADFTPQDYSEKPEFKVKREARRDEMLKRKEDAEYETPVPIEPESEVKGEAIAAEALPPALEQRIDNLIERVQSDIDQLATTIADLQSSYDESRVQAISELIDSDLSDLKTYIGQFDFSQTSRPEFKSELLDLEYKLHSLKDSFDYAVSQHEEIQQEEKYSGGSRETQAKTHEKRRRGAKKKQLRKKGKGPSDKPDLF